MFEQRRWPIEAWIPVATGLLWLWCAASFGVLGFIFSLLPGCLLLSSGVATLLYPGDVRIPQFIAAGGLWGIPLALPSFFVAGWPTGLALVVLSAVSFLSAGVLSVRQEPHVDDVPAPEPSGGLALQVAIDDAILAGLSVRTSIVADTHRVLEEVHNARELFDERGWLEDPAAFHEEPPLLEGPSLKAERRLGIDYQHLSFPSGYEPRREEPGCERWLSYEPTRTAHAWVLAHEGGPRSWILCIPGYEMGNPGLDLLAFRARYLHEKLGLNVLIPVLPLHGPRRIGRVSGTGFLAGDFLDSIHAEAQAMWDIRRLYGWVRRQTDKPVGVFGLSLGGYNAALFSELADDLAFVLAGIPATDFTRLTLRHGPTMQVRYAESHGLVHDEVAEILRVVSPLAIDCRVPKDRRFIFAGVADRLVPSDQPRDLWRHWERPRIEWYQGAHLTFRGHARIRSFMTEVFREGGLEIVRDGRAGTVASA